MRSVFGAALLLLAGCATGTERGIFSEFGESLSTIGLPGRTEAPGRVTASDATLNAAPSNILLVEVESRGNQAGLVLDGINRDTITWRSPGDVTITTQGGQLIGTAGFGNDLASARAPAIGAGQGRVVRDQYHLGGDEEMELTRYFCTLAIAGAERVVVTGRAFDTALLTETCETEDGAQVENRYWIDGLGVVRQSRQFAGEEIGYLFIQDVHTGLR
ncbi:group 4 capsule polysaccharide lipoprotein GfcB/YjbF [Palleronia aestuarii]|uniref:Group 4 capsule polysaccharide lipoprotein GfcB/YjbF n=2 Tax=Palleronia aestuarii TaxID=568105 RepID=A0A2W7NFJ7_9RHOB|nr:group 4 capsule polysaccharide lipoprotein GfcB/YjbF [Palleronia aestuarii]